MMQGSLVHSTASRDRLKMWMLEPEMFQIALLNTALGVILGLAVVIRLLPAIRVSSQQFRNTPSQSCLVCQT